MDSFDYGSYEDMVICDQFSDFQKANKTIQKQEEKLEPGTPNFADILANKMAYNLKFWDDLTK